MLDLTGALKIFDAVGVIDFQTISNSPNASKYGFFLSPTSGVQNTPRNRFKRRKYLNDGTPKNYLNDGTPTKDGRLNMHQSMIHAQKTGKNALKFMYFFFLFFLSPSKDKRLNIFLKITYSVILNQSRGILNTVNPKNGFTHKIDGKLPVIHNIKNIIPQNTFDEYRFLHSYLSNPKTGCALWRYFSVMTKKKHKIRPCKIRHYIVNAISAKKMDHDKK